MTRPFILLCLSGSLSAWAYFTYTAGFGTGMIVANWPALLFGITGQIGHIGLVALILK